MENKRKAGPRALLAALTAALLAAVVGVATPALAQGFGTSGDPLDTAAELAQALNGNTAPANGNITASGNTVIVKGQGAQSITDDIFFAPSDDITIQLDGNIDLGVKGSVGNSLYVYGGGSGNSLTIQGSGTMSSSGTTIVVDNGGEGGADSVLNMSNGTVTSTGSAAIVVKAGTANITGGTISSSANLNSSGNPVQALQCGMKVTLGQPSASTGPTITNPNGVGVAVFYMGHLTINSASISGQTGMYINNNPAVNSGAVTGEQAGLSVEMNGGSISGSQIGILTDSAVRSGSGGDSGNYGQSKVTLVDGTISAPNGNAIQDESQCNTNGNVPKNSIVVGSSTTGEGPEITGNIVCGKANTNTAGDGNLTINGGTVDGSVANLGEGSVTVGSETNGIPNPGPLVSGYVAGDGATFSSGTALGGLLGGAAPSTPGNVLSAAYGDNQKAFGTSPMKLSGLDDEDIVLGSYDENTPYTGPTPVVEMPEDGNLTNNTGVSVEMVAPDGVPGTLRPGQTGSTPEPPAPPTPGSPNVVQNDVLGAKQDVVDNAKDYANVTVSSNLLDWTVAVTDGSAGTVGDVATGVLGPIVSALSGSGATSATSVQNAQLKLALPASPEDQATFCQSVLDNAVAISAMAASSPVSSLEGRTCGITVACTDGTNLTYTFTFTGNSAPAPEPTPEGTVAVYRLYNQWAGTHLYTTDTTEVARCVADGWTNEHVYWYAPATVGEGDYVIVRLYNPFNGDHYYVPESDAQQIDGLLALGWQRDSRASWIVSAPKDSEFPVYTLFNPYRDVDTHLYTPQAAERAQAIADGWEPNTTVIWAAALPTA